MLNSVGVRFAFSPSTQRRKAFSHPRNRRISRRPQRWPATVRAESSDEMHQFWEKVESTQNELHELEQERDDAARKADEHSRRSRRLTEAIQNMYEAAFGAVKEGNEGDAARLLRDKTNVMSALEAARSRAEANAALAAKLEHVIGDKQMNLLEMIQKAGKGMEKPDKEIEEMEETVVRSTGESAWASKTLQPEESTSNEA
ncbi:hypothetical protein BSKO_04995 [Bryopsis sp. KO-2023]|nr:hypothetical protein BSKO_04995 [Bryopsis sp. KO-2023]